MLATVEGRYTTTNTDGVRICAPGVPVAEISGDRTRPLLLPDTVMLTATLGRLVAAVWRNPLPARSATPRAGRIGPLYAIRPKRRARSTAIPASVASNGPWANGRKRRRNACSTSPTSVCG